MAFIGPCFTTHFNQTGVDSEEGVARFQAGGRNAIPSIQEGVENDKQKLMGKSAMHDVEVVPKSVKKSTSSNSKMKDENHKQNHLQGEQSKNNNIPAVKKMSYHSKNNRTKIVGRHGLPQDKISSGVTVNKTSWGQNLTQLDDIFIGVKTGGVYHDKRLNLLLETWVTTAKNQVSCIVRPKTDVCLPFSPTGPKFQKTFFFFFGYSILHFSTKVLRYNFQNALQLSKSLLYWHRRYMSSPHTCIHQIV